MLTALWSLRTPATPWLLTRQGSPGTQGTTGIYPHEFDPWDYPIDPRDTRGAYIPVFPGDTMDHRNHPPPHKSFLHKKMFTFYNPKTPYCCNPCVGGLFLILIAVLWPPCCFLLQSSVPWTPSPPFFFL